MLSDDQKYDLLKKHLGLEKHRDACVIDRASGKYTDAARYFVLMAEIERSAIPPGWRLVPEKLTDDMVLAFCEQWYSHMQCIDDPQMDEAYAALLAAAPTTPVKQQQVGPWVAVPRRGYASSYWVLERSNSSWFRGVQTATGKDACPRKFLSEQAAIKAAEKENRLSK